MTELRIGGFTGLTTIDYPGQLAAVVFCQGCAWRCGYCHNPSLWPAYPTPVMAWPELLALLTRRRKLLDAVVFSGGEPTAQSALYPAMQEVKSLGFKLGLHTAGVYPRRLAQVLPLLDWVGLDVKTTVDRYPTLTGSRYSADKLQHSLQQVIASAVAYEIRTTVHAKWLPWPALQELAGFLVNAGVQHWVLQESNWPEPMLGPVAQAYFAKATAQFSPLFASLTVRRR